MVQCPGCRTVLHIQGQQVSQVLACPRCRTQFALAQPAQPAQPQARAQARGPVQQQRAPAPAPAPQPQQPPPQLALPSLPVAGAWWDRNKPIGVKTITIINASQFPITCVISSDPNAYKLVNGQLQVGGGSVGGQFAKERKQQVVEKRPVPAGQTAHISVSTGFVYLTVARMTSRGTFAVVRAGRETAAGSTWQASDALFQTTLGEVASL